MISWLKSMFGRNEPFEEPPPQLEMLRAHLDDLPAIQVPEGYELRTYRPGDDQAWCDIMEGSDVCFAPVLSIFEAPEHPHNKARETFVEVDGIMQPAPSPRFSRTVPRISHGARVAGEDSVAVLKDCGFDDAEIGELQQAAVIPS